MNSTSLTLGLFICEETMHMEKYIPKNTEPAYVLNETVGINFTSFARLMASHPPRPSEHCSEMKYGQEC